MIKTINYKLKKENIDMSMPLIDRLLIARNLSYAHLEGSYSDLHDPYLINDMEIAVSRILRARKNKEKVLIYGDYDCDGITSTLTLLTGFREIGIDCDYYIPRRLIDGYGMNMNSIYDILEDDYSLVVTVDCGITALHEIEVLQENGIDVIVTDHHECKEELPPALAVLDNKRKDNEYPFPELCGAGVAFKLLTAIFEELGLEGQEKKYLLLTAIGTVADVMPLIGENRIIVQEGLNLIKTSQEPSIKNLLRVAGKLENVESLTAQDIAFYIGPLINASSRVGDINCAINLLMAKSEEEAILNADELLKFNNQRKLIEKDIIDEAFSQIINTYDFNSLAPIVVYGNNWHKGVIGIIASRIVEKFNRPTIILTKEENETVYHGSCRSYKDIDMMSILNYAKDSIIQFGGHTGAAGLTVKDTEIENLIQKLKEYALHSFNEEMFVPETVIDTEIKPEEITLENFEKIVALEPFGHMNEEPVFICRNLKTKVLKKIGTKAGSENAHLKITFSIPSDSLTIINGVGFFMGDYVDLLPSGRFVDVVFKLAENVWNGNRTVQIMIEDILYHPVHKEGLTVEEDALYLEDVVTIDDIVEEYSLDKNELLPNKQEYVLVFKEFQKIFEEPNKSIIVSNLNYLAPVISTRINQDINPFKLSRILEVLDESNNLTFRHMLFDNVLITKPLGNKETIRLTQTSKFKKNHNL